jgi:hypothetical protein
MKMVASVTAFGQEKLVASGGSPVTRSTVATGLAAPPNRLLLHSRHALYVHGPCQFRGKLSLRPKNVQPS